MIAKQLGTTRYSSRASWTDGVYTEVVEFQQLKGVAVAVMPHTSLSGLEAGLKRMFQVCIKPQEGGLPEGDGHIRSEKWFW